MTDNLMTIEQAAAYLSLSRSTIYVLIAAGELPIVRYGRSVRLQPSALRAWVEQHVVSAPGDGRGAEAGA